MKWLLFLLVPISAFTQSTDIFLVEFNKNSSNYSIENPKLLSGFNKKGYTNQPFFADHSLLMVSAASIQDLASTDLYELNIQTRKLKQITKTPDREYSPQLSPDGKYLSCVVVDVERGNRQILWLYPLDQQNGGKGLLKTIHDVGYYCWLGPNSIAVYRVNDPNKLYMVNTQTGKSQFISSNTGRCFKRLSDGSLAFVNKYSEEHWFLRKINPNTLQSEIIKSTLSGVEDFEVLNDDSIIMAKDSKLYHLDPAGENTWKEIADLKDWGLQQISRIAYNGVNLLALVNERD